MVKKNDLSCVFTPATGEATIYQGKGEDKKAVIVGRDLKDTKDDWLNRFQTTVKYGEHYEGKASLSGVGDPSKSSATFEVFLMNKETMGCAVKELGVDAVPAPRTAPTAAGPAGPAPAR